MEGAGPDPAGFAVGTTRDRRPPRFFGALLAAGLLLGAPPAAGATLDATQAGSHIGETATVCGSVASAHFSRRSAAQPTLLDLDRPYPNQIFTLVIFGRDRAKFGTPETALLHRRVCASGAIKLYRGRPEMILEDPAQLSP